MAADTPRLKRDWNGRKVRTLRPLNNGWHRVPAGTVCTVERNFNGLRLLAEPCPWCSVQIRITRVHESAVELIPRDEEPPPPRLDVALHTRPEG